MTIAENSFVFNGLTIDGPDDPDLVLFAGNEQGITGFDLPQFDTRLTPRRGRNGAVGGPQSSGAATIQTRLVALTDDARLEFRQAMKPRPNPRDELPLSFAGFGFPGEHRMYVRPAGCDFRITPSAVFGKVYVIDASWVVADGLIYSEDQATYSVASGSPQSTVSFEAPNLGLETGTGGRSWEFRMTAHGTTTNPTIRVDHADGTWERLSFTGLTMSSGQVLTIGDDLVPRVGSVSVNGRARWANESVTNARGSIGGLRLFPSDGEDEQNEVTMSVASGAFSGFCKTRSVW